VGAGAATAPATELTAASIRHNPKICPGAKHVFFNDQLRPATWPRPPAP